MGDDTPDAYFSKIDSIITLLTDLGSTMDDDDIVTYAINGLSEKYRSLAQILADPFPDLATVRTMVTTEEMRLRSKQPILSTSTTSSSPQVLLATSQPRIQDNRNNRDRDARDENKTEICHNFGRGLVLEICGGADTAYLLLYVDDIVLTASSFDLLQQIITSLHAEFSMTDLGSLNYFLGISVTRNASGMFLSQQKYATE
ncbi:hybrid signal transduction histidine kinase M, partial [Tanacetum coccineum]